LFYLTKPILSVDIFKKEYQHTLLVAISKTGKSDGKKKFSWGNIFSWDNTYRILTLLTFIFVAYQTFISGPSAENKLQQIALNTYTPKPYLSSEGNCYIMDSQFVKKYFKLDENISGNYYVDEYILRSGGTYASKPWIRITLPKNIMHLSVASEPPAPFLEKQEKDWQGNINKIISISWDNLNLAPGNEVKVRILYNDAGKTTYENLKSMSRNFNYGYIESGEYYGNLYCGGFEIFQD